MHHGDFKRLRDVLPGHYLPAPHPPVVGYLRGSKSPGVWRAKIAERNPQMMLLGNVEPTREQWEHAGVGHRTGETQLIYLYDLEGFIICGGVMNTGRPWGSICDENEDSRTLGFPRTLEYFRRLMNQNE